VPNAFEKARRGTNPPPVTPAQRRYLKVLCEQTGVELPVVRWSHEATQVIDRLERRRRQPTLTDQGLA
jgi:hypothetical protein